MELDDVDYASLVATLEERIERKDIATALGVDIKTIDDIASGYVPDDALATKLRALATSGKADDRGIDQGQPPHADPVRRLRRDLLRRAQRGRLRRDALTPLGTAKSRLEPALLLGGI
jgi:hypothetical protein